MVPDRRHRRVALMAARVAARPAPEDALAARRAEAEAKLLFCKRVREGLAALGLDPDKAAMLVRNEADARAILDAPLDPAPPIAAAGPPVDAKFEALVAHYRDPASAPPDLAKEPLNTLWAYVLARGGTGRGINEPSTNQA